MWSVVRLAVVLMVFAGAVPAHAASEAGSGEWHHFEVVRTGAGASSFELILDMAPPPGEGDIDGFWGSVGFRTDDVGQVQSVVGLGATPLGKTNEPGFFVDGTEVSTCTAAGICNAQPTLAAQSVLGYRDDGEPDGLNRFYVVVEGKVDLIETRFEADGWVLAKTSLDVRYVDQRESEGVAIAASPNFSANIFFSAALPGGELGSLAMAMPPCSQATSGVVSRGAGRLTLRGGLAEQTGMCPFVGGNGVLADHSPAATQWEATGPVIGDTSLHEGRLFVVDLPSCRRLIPGVVGAAEVEC